MPVPQSQPDIFKVITLPYKPSQEYFDCIEPLPKRVWLDCSAAGSKLNRFDILSAAPIDVLKNPSFAALKAAIDSLGIERGSFSEFPFTGGAIGYYNYEHRKADFKLSRKSESPSLWGIYNWAIIQDHVKRESYVLFLNSMSEIDISAIEALVSTNTGSRPSNERFNVSPFTQDISKADYLLAFDKIQRYIQSGDCYQINYAQRFSAVFSGSASQAYKHLRSILPSSYSAYLSLGEEHILSFSPEQFIRIDGASAQSKPIKGTIRRGLNPDEDRALASELLKSEKNRAENLMIVDLLRNDFSKNCKAWSVQTPQLFKLESYANVHHLVSTIEGQLNDGVDATHFFEHCFPGGSITGAPKQRAMEIIEELETHPRNIYCGSIGYFSSNGKAESNIAIRTLLIKKENIYCWGGGGIVADSSAEEEYAESIQKVAILLDSLEADTRPPNTQG